MNTLKLALGLTTAVVALSAGAAQAQDTTVTTPSTVACDDTDANGVCDADENTGTIVVTGSRIAQPNADSANPITVVRGEALYETGQVAVGDVLNELPQLRNTYSQQNSTRFLGTRGLNLLDLRGLGSSRTLVLVDGRRHVAGDILVNGVSPDVNTIPTDLIERVDVVTGGASAVYGSDAMAGVVNFILKKNYDGVQLRGQAGVSKYGDAGNQYASLLAGKNFADDRGNVAVNLEYAHTSRFLASGRPNLRQNDAFVVVDTDAAGSLNGSDGVSDRQYFYDIRSTTISTGGQVGIRYPNAGAPCGVDSVGNAYTCAYLFQPDGSLIPQTGLRIGLGPNGNFVGGNGYSGREGELLALTPDLQRYSANMRAHFEITPALVPFLEAKYVRSEAYGSQSGPFFSQGQTLSDGVAVSGFNDRSYASTTTAPAGTVNREGIRLDNPYLTAQARTLLTTQLLAALNANVNPNTGTAFTTSAQSQANRAAAIAQVNNGTFRFSNRRNYVDLGIRDEKIVRETYRIVGGLRGEFNDDWNYELALNYGEHRETNSIKNNINRQRFLLANDAAVNSAGQIVCRSQIDSRYAGTDRGGNPAQLAADIAACVPINPFGDGSVTDAARQYLTVDSLATGKITQFDVLGYVTGDLSGLFELPGGPIAFSVGGEYRRETNEYDLDDITQAGYAFYNAIPAFTAPAFEVKEAFAEVQVPLLKDVPFFQELTLRGNGRVADYKGKTGTVYAYGGEVLWKPIRDLTLRGTYARSVRAPNLSELYSAQFQNFAPAPNDPCSERNLANGSTYRAANCAAAGRPTGYDFVYTSSLEIRGGGNPDLEAEKSDSYTLGALLEPRFIPGFAISVDFYDITIKNVITSIGSAQTILNQCYDSPTLDNLFCGLFERAGASGGPRGEIPFRVLEGSLLQSTANFAKLKVRGIDAQVTYSHKFDWGALNLQGVYTHQIKNESYTDPLQPTFRNVFIGELADPQDEFNINASLKIGKVTLGYGLRFIGEQYLNTYEDYNSVNGLAPQNTDYAPIQRYPTVTYSDVRAELEVDNRFSIYFGVDNLFDKKPPYGLTGVGAGSGIFDNRGRYMYTGAVAKF
ncbi:TonB-dependent receptor-like protein [Novosphingobium kunmingense]|uniref:TonB-dependent receptor-like protein n=1 Tax=Novosphingobium kunmingense TaxID=1211806 RepID=A0A2N0HKM2_9SPHN|nr:TonB-dependent receptor [Novosphingobium kunmingense]PKB19500.1 TonB-dependent receptor-like protein [Novosphingobium kunmingense]